MLEALSLSTLPTLPILGSYIWIGGGGLGLILLIVIIVLILR